MTESITRRHALMSLATAAGTLAAVPAAHAAAADARPHVAKNDPTAMALAYFEDAKQVDPKKFPTFKPEQLCENCLQITGNAGDAWRPCNLFPGKLVASKGWCKVYVKKP